MNRGGHGRLFGWAIAPVVFLLLFPAAGVSATITPDSLADNFTPDADCSLREAIQVANSDSAAVEDDCGVAGTLGTDTISLAAGTYALGAGFPEDGTPDDNAQGDLDVSGSLTIDGQGAGSTTIDPSAIMAPVRALHALSGQVSLEQLTVTSGHPTGTDGGGVRSESGASLNLLSSVVRMSSAANGGGIASAGPLTLTDSIVNGNVAGGDGGGVYATGAATFNGSAVDGNDAGDDGGGIASSASVTFTGTGSVSDNDTLGGISADGGGIYSGAFAGPVSIGGALTVNANDAQGAGGGIFLISTNVSPTITGATLTGNDALNTGGGIFYESLPDDLLTVSSTSFTGNFGQSGGGGLTTQAPTSISGSTFTGNTAGEIVDDSTSEGYGGGAINTNGGPTTVVDTTLEGNALTTASADSLVGGAINNGLGQLVVRRSTLAANTIANGANRNGAGISGSGNTSTLIENSTLTGNSISGTGSGGALFASPGTASLTVVQSTIVANIATTGSGIFNNGPLALRGSIIAQGVGGCAGAGTITANAHNLENATSCVGAADDSDLENTDALLGPLLPNGGPTETRLPGAGGPAVDAVPAAACDDLAGGPLTVDQRGLPRPDDGNANAVSDCEAGAVELQVSGPPQSVQPPASKPAQKKCKKKRKKKRAVAGAKKKKKKCKKKRRKKK